MGSRHCIAVVSPFLDKRHGTERCVAEQVERLAHEHGYEVHLYSQRVEDVEALEEFSAGKQQPRSWRVAEDEPGPTVSRTGRILWHRISHVPGPHVVQYVWWFLANQFRRWRDQRAHELRYDLVYSPGINCWDADAIAVHIVFQEFYGNVVRDGLRLRKIPLRSWPRALHRQLYYRLIMALEKRIYSDPRVTLAAVSYLVSGQLHRRFGREDIHVILGGVDIKFFSSEVRIRRRVAARQQWGLREKDFVLLLIGNDWRTKGLGCLLEAAARCRELPVEILVVGGDDRGPYEASILRLGLQGRVRFAKPASDVQQFYAVADAYVAPSLYDSYARPVTEAMACGLPVIVSQEAGVSEIIQDGVNGLILVNPKDAIDLAAKIRLLFESPNLCRRLGEGAERRARDFSWERYVEQTRAFLEFVQKRKSS